MKLPMGLTVKITKVRIFFDCTVFFDALFAAHGREEYEDTGRYIIS